MKLEMWANAQRDGHPADRPLRLPRKLKKERRKKEKEEIRG